MFDFLNKLSHGHSKKQQSNNKVQLPKQSEDINQFSQVNYTKKAGINLKANKKVQKQPIKKLLSISAQLQIGECAELPPQTMMLLQKIRDESQLRLNKLPLNMMQERRIGIERKVYLRQMSHNNEQYLQEVLVESSSDNRYVRHGLSEIIYNVTDAITADIIDTDMYRIQKRVAMGKDDISLLANSLSQIKNKQGSLRSKVGELKMHLMSQAQSIDERSDQIINKTSFAPDHPKTKQVQFFLKNIQLQREYDRRRYQQKIRQQKLRKQKEQQMQQIMKEKALSERHERLAQVYEIKRKIKQEQKSVAQKRDEEFKNFLNTYKKQKPMFRQKQEQFQQNFIKKKEEDIFYKLLQRKQTFVPIDFQDIQDHDERYIEYKQQHKAKRKQQLKLLKHAEKSRIQQAQKLHKGRSRFFVLQQMVQKKEKKDPRLKLKQNKLKQKAYSMNVKQYHPPSIDPAKRMEIESLIMPKKSNRYGNPIRMRVSSSYDGGNPYYVEEDRRVHNTIEVEKDAKKQGEKNRRFLKQYLGQKQLLGHIKKQSLEQQLKRASTIEHKTSYLDEIRRERENRENREKTAMNYDSIDQQISLIKNRYDAGALIAKVEQYDSKVERLQKKLRNAAHKPEEEQQLQRDYLYSIKAKIQLLNDFD